MIYRRTLATLLFVATPLSVISAQLGPPVDDPKLPNGKSQKEEILRSDHEQSLEDAAELSKLVEELKIELEKNDRHVVSLSSLKKLDTIEKLTKRIRSRLKRY